MNTYEPAGRSHTCQATDCSNIFKTWDGPRRYCSAPCREREEQRRRKNRRKGPSAQLELPLCAS